MFSGAKPALGQGPGWEAWGRDRLHAQCPPHPSACPQEIISAFHSIRLAGLLPSPPAHLALSVCLEEVAGGRQKRKQLQE